MKKYISMGMIILLLVISFSLPVLAEDGEEAEAFGFELEKLLNLGSGLLAAALSILTFVSYKRTRNKRLLYVGLAFMLFSLKSLLVGVEIFFGEWPGVDHISSIADFFILLSFFLGIIKK
jgi:hypothetical protein